MLRLSSQFDRARTRPVVAAPKSSGCCCCCCCCIVTVLGTSITAGVLTARSISRSPAKPSKTADSTKQVMDGWGTEPVKPEPATDSEPEPETPPPVAIPEVSSAQKIGWTAVAVVLIPLVVLVLPGLWAVVASTAQSSLENDGVRIALVVSSWVVYLAVAAFLRFAGRFGVIGLVIPTTALALATAAAVFDGMEYLPMTVVNTSLLVGGLVTLHRRAHVRKRWLALLGVLLPVLLALEVVAWFYLITGL